MAEFDNVEFDEDAEGENLDVPDKEDGPKINKEMADKEFESWAKHLRLDTDLDEMDVEEKSDFLQIKKKFVYSLLHDRRKWRSHLKSDRSNYRKITNRFP